MANADALRARATHLYDLSEKVDNWGERLRLRYRAKMLECEAKTAVGDDIPEAHVIASTTSDKSA
jgi:hypothetical protein